MNIVGKQVLLSYFDQNENYRAFLPKTGIIEKRLTSKNVDNWFLLKLNKPFSYAGVKNRKLLVRSRWEGVEIGDEDEVSVFIVQIPDNSIIQGDSVVIKEENLVAWGTISVNENTSA